jgi:hypothetical protein
MYTLKNKDGLEVQIGKNSWSILIEILRLLEHNPNRKWNNIHTHSGMSYNQYKYWCERLVTWGYAQRFEHGHNQYNFWTGYKLLKSENDIWYEMTGIPF